MAQILVRGLEEDVKEKLRARAKEHGRSLEAEVRLVLTESVECDRMDEPAEKIGLGTRFARLFADIEEPFEVPEMRGGRWQVPDFSE